MGGHLAGTGGYGNLLWVGWVRWDPLAQQRELSVVPLPLEAEVGAVQCTEQMAALVG